MSTFKNKLLLSYITYGIALVLVAVFTVNKVYEANKKEQHLIDTVDKLVEQKLAFKKYTQNIESKLYTIRDSKIFKSYLNKNEKDNLEDLFMYIANTSKDLMQLRYIDKNGYEKIRIDKLDKDSLPVVILKEELQNKSQRYYFKEIINIEDEEKSWYSKIDLNIEHGELEKPIKPVFRIGIPVFVKGEKVGILVINIAIKYFLQEISNMALYNVYLIDKDGNFIIHPKKEYSWSKYLDTKYSVKDQFKDSYKNILGEYEYIGKTLYSSSIDLDNNENIKIIFEPKYYKLEEEINSHINEMLVIMFFMILLSFLVANVFSSKFANLKERVDSLNDTLEETVKEKTKKLQKLNETLEQRVEQEVDKNREKEKQLLYQSRLAQMGEMISMIAHQWRQPLASISSTIGTMKLDVMMGNYEKEFFTTSLNKMSDYTQHLSATIDDFRGFFKDDKEQKSVTLEDVLESSLRILAPLLSTNDIKLIKEYNCNKVFTTYQNELKQVILNLVKNAEDVLLERKIKAPTICFRSYINKENNRYVLEISDNAGGISDEIMHDIFMPYFSTKINKDGTGLGLYMSKMIIEEHCNGKLSVSNNNEGAIFKIEISSI